MPEQPEALAPARAPKPPLYVRAAARAGFAQISLRRLMQF
jgi:hypothetical protein